MLFMSIKVLSSQKIYLFAYHSALIVERQKEKKRKEEKKRKARKRKEKKKEKGKQESLYLPFESGIRVDIQKCL